MLFIISPYALVPYCALITAYGIRKPAAQPAIHRSVCLTILANVLLACAVLPAHLLMNIGLSHSATINAASAAFAIRDMTLSPRQKPAAMQYLLLMPGACLTAVF